MLDGGLRTMVPLKHASTSISRGIDAVNRAGDRRRPAWRPDDFQRTSGKNEVTYYSSSRWWTVMGTDFEVVACEATCH